ncbi:MAG: flavin oxidoreductase/NADH oxidase, partial [Candidatus Gallimonas sp.]
MINEKYHSDKITVHNRVVFQPMEGCDCNGDGSPGALTKRKYLRLAAGKAGIIWFEASAVCEEGRTN